MKRTGYSAMLEKIVVCVFMSCASFTRTSNFETDMPKYAGRRLAITWSTVLLLWSQSQLDVALQSQTITSELHQARQKSKIYALTPYECVHRTRMPHLIFSRNNCPTGLGLWGFEGKIGEPEITPFGCVCSLSAQQLSWQLRQDIARRSVSTRQNGNLWRRG